MVVSSLSPILWTMASLMSCSCSRMEEAMAFQYASLSSPPGGSPRRPVVSSSVFAGAAPLHELAVVCLLLRFVCRGGWGWCGAAKLPAIPDLVIPRRGGWGDRLLAPPSCCASGFKNLVHFSICACHPCAGAMLIFSVSFQFYLSLSSSTQPEGVRAASAPPRASSRTGGVKTGLAQLAKHRQSLRPSNHNTRTRGPTTCLED